MRGSMWKEEENQTLIVDLIKKKDCGFNKKESKVSRYSPIYNAGV